MHVEKSSFTWKVLINGLDHLLFFYGNSVPLMQIECAGSEDIWEQMD